MILKVLHLSGQLLIGNVKPTLKMIPVHRSEVLRGPLDEEVRVCEGRVLGLFLLLREQLLSDLEAALRLVQKCQFAAMGGLWLRMCLLGSFRRRQ